MKRFVTILMLVTIFVGTAGAQAFQQVTVRDVQQVPDSVLNVAVQGDEASPLLGDTLWVRGVVKTAPRLNDGSAQWFTGDRWRFVLTDPTQADFNNITVVASDTAYFNTVGIDQLFIGDSVEILGVITEYRTLTQLEVLRADTVLKLHGVSTYVPTPTVVPLSDLFTGLTRKYNPGEKRESDFIRLENLTVIGVNGAEFSVADALGNQMIVDDQSNRIFGVTPPVVGSTIDWVQGYLFTNGNLDWTISPRDTADYQIGTVFPPTFENTELTPYPPTPSSPLTITAKVYDRDGSVANVSMYYWVNGTPMGPVTMTTNGTDSMWTTTLPAVGVDSAYVEGFLRAQDNDGNYSTDPGTADSADASKPRGFFFVLNRPPTIREVQYNRFGGTSSYQGDTLTLTGVATADRSDFGQVVMQDGTGKWSGIIVLSSEDSVVRKGDNLTVRGVIAENFAQTIIRDASITVNSSGNALPAPSFVFSGGVRTGGSDAEAYESVLIQLANAFVVDVNPDRVSNSNFGEFAISELITEATGLRVKVSSTASSGQDRANIQFTNRDEAGKIPLFQRDRFGSVKGILYYAFSHFKLVPRDSNDFSGYQNIFTSVETLSDQVPGEYRLSQNYPNPFNPSTVIEYAIGKQEHVVLTVFNMLGQQVGTIVNGIQPAGTYKVTLGSEFFSGLSTGMYVYRIQAGDFVTTKKLLLVR